ncbi:sulfatase family protein [Stratiformator vulcanicus]|uniref:Choline-sulfatase n=1 Tax=Stratiformator vulcanicus TaxID=2527980 RepID=A0A517QYH1_9PLAN|nr:sulfatase [Stratiformator vulcanicus]QDT36638.1 Choline-sulfatase [Stratiformator vulcanicus]
MKVALTLIAIAAGWTFPLSVFAAAESRPNFLLIVADDLCWRDLGVTGNPDVKTPHIDRLATDGMSLSGMFTPAPTCSPCRHALYTGLYPVRSGAYPNHAKVDPATRSLFVYLRDSGYRVGLHNKSHVAPFESFPFEQVGEREDDFAAIREFIQRDATQPWLLVFASSSPHSPWSKGPQGRYDPEKLTVPSYLHDNPTTREALARYYAEINALDDQVGRLESLLKDTKTRDETVTLFLSEQGSAFPFGGKWTLSDNGIRVAAFLRWPGRVQPKSRTDALVQYVDVAPTFLEMAGIVPATIDTGCPDALGNVGFDGRSFLGLVTGATDRHREYVFAEHTAVGVAGYKEPYPQRCVRDGRFKLVRNLMPENEFFIRGIHQSSVYRSWLHDAESDEKLIARIDRLSVHPAVELFDLQNDPFETNNIAEDPRYEEHRRRLSGRLDAWMKQQGDEGIATELNAKSRQAGRKQWARDRRMHREANRHASIGFKYEEIE